MYAILEGKTVKPVDECLRWASWFEKNDGYVGKDVIDGVRISTVFIGLDHGFGGRPEWFETTIFGGMHTDYQGRYETWEEAEAGHKKAVALVRGE